VILFIARASKNPRKVCSPENPASKSKQEAPILKIRKNMLSRKSCNCKKSRGKAHPDGRHFKIALYENNIRIKNKPEL
jgi:hypothetical protein